MSVKDKLKNVWKEYKQTKKENLDAAQDYYDKYIKDKSIKEKLKHSFKYNKYK